ncbi:hypothetical protein LguiB_025325 [Lonicera macranthoides]
MGDLHSIAYRGGLYSSSQVMDSAPPPFHSPHDSDLSTGYLQDALFEFSSKQRRLLLCSNDQTKESTYPIESYWNSSSTENFCYLSQINCRINSITGVPLNNSASGVTESETMLTEMQTPLEEAVVVPPASEDIDSSSVNAQFISDKENQHPTFPYGTLFLYMCTVWLERTGANPGFGLRSPLIQIFGKQWAFKIPRKKEFYVQTLILLSWKLGGLQKRAARRGIVYPFGVVKPGGIEGEVTLEDINKRIVRPPTRPVKHPVGEFACRPKVVHSRGIGFSGKAVVALTTIQTRGRGTITIIRTKGN